MNKTSSPTSASEDPSSVSLEPFVHQVGGHFPMICLDDEIVCKPLNDREHKFYKTLPRQLKPFAPNFEGTMRVETAEDPDGYITLRGKPPPGYAHPRRCSSVSAAGALTPCTAHHPHYRLKRKNSIEIEPMPTTSAPQSTSSTPPSTSILSASVPANASCVSLAEAGQHRRTSPSSSFYNPWALKCHRDHLKKLGLLSKQQQEGSSSAEDKKSRRTNPQTYLLLENLVSRYRYPCILDLKVGSRQYADDVSAAKKQRKMAKAANSTLASLALRLCGMQVFNAHSGTYICRNKYYGRTLGESGFKATIAEFLCNESEKIRKDVLEKLLEKLCELKKILSQLDSFRFYTSSLLVTYDGSIDDDVEFGSQNDLSSSDMSSTLQDLNGDEGVEDEEDMTTAADEISELEEASCGENSSVDLVDVRIIDFAHSTHKGLKDSVIHSGPDEGFITGLSNFIGILQEISDGKVKPGSRSTTTTTASDE